jgi:hypothetical protein
MWLHFTVHCYTHYCPQSRSYYHCLVVASNGGRSPCSGFLNCSRSQLPASNSNSSWQLNRSSPLTNSLPDWLTATSQSQSYVMTDGQLASLSWYQTLVWGPRPGCCCCQTVAGLLMWYALSDERTGLSFTIAAGLHQHTDSRIWVPQVLWPYFTVSDSRLPQPGGPGLRIYIP